MVLGPVVWLSLLHPKASEATWFDDNWMYRNAVPVSKTVADQTNVYIDVTVNTSATGQFQADCGDIRWTDQNGKLLPYYLDGACPNVASSIHVFFSTLNQGTQTIYYYYGNPSAPNGFNAANFASAATNYTIGDLGAQEYTPGPVAYWKFDEGVDDTCSGGINDVCDSTRNALDGAKTGATWQTENMCVSGKCLMFDGSNDYVSIGNPTSLQLTTAFTLSAWIKTFSSATQGIITKYNANNDASVPYYLAIVSGQIRAYVNGDTSCSSQIDVYRQSTKTVNDGLWHHVVGVYSGSAQTLLLYIDGVSETGTLTGTVPTATANCADNVEIGSMNANAGGTRFGFFSGTIDEPKIYHSRSASQIKTDYTGGKAHMGTVKGAAVALGNNNKNGEFLSDGLVGYWKMDETAANSCSDGTDTCDSSGNAMNGTWVDHASYGPGKFGNGTVYDGVDEFLDDDRTTIADNDLLDFGAAQDFSFSMWFKRDTPGATEVLFNKSSGSVGYEVNFNGSNQVRLWINGAYLITTTNALTDSTSWHQVVVTVKRNGKTDLYIDGINWASVASNQNTTANNGSLFVGSNGTSAVFDGNIDEFRIYNRALTPNEVSQLYNWAPGPVGWWKMDEGSWDGTANEVKDSSGFGNNGTATSATTTSGKFGHAGQFNDSSSLVTVTAGASSNLTDLPVSKAFSISAWIYNNAALADNEYDSIVSKSDIGGVGYIFNILRWSSTYYLDCELTATVDPRSTAAIPNPLGGWHHVFARYDDLGDRKIDLFYDGVELTYFTETPATGPITTDSTHDFFIGAYYNWNIFGGKIDDVKIYNYWRTNKQIIEDMNADHPAPGSPVSSALGYWKFDEGADNTCSGGANDVCNSGFKGTTLDGTSTATRTDAGKYGKALDFDGTDDVATIADSATVDLYQQTGYSVCGWIAPDNAGEGNAGEWWSKGNSYVRVDTLSGSTVEVSALFDLATDDATRNTTKTIPTTTYSNICVTWEDDLDDELSIYINGQLEGSSVDGNGSAADDSASQVLIGGDSSNNFDGKIDEVKIYNFALTADEVKTEYNHASAVVMGALSDNSSYEKQADNQEYCIPGDTTACVAPIGEWKMDENTGTNAFDTSGNNYVGALGEGTPAYQPTWVAGKKGSALSFDGTNDYVTPGSINLSDTALTISAWVYPKVFQSIWPYISTIASEETGSPDNAASIRFGDADLANNKLQFILGNGGVYQKLNGVAALNTNTWYHVAGVYNGSTMTIYINGIQDNQRNLASRDSINTTFYIGANRLIADYFFNGIIDDVKIFNYARTPAQIAWDYNRGGTIAWWKFDECQGTTLNDASGNLYTGTWSGSGGTQTSAGTCSTASTAWGNGVVGKFNSSLNFDSADDIVTVTDTANLRFDASTQDFSLFAWVKRAASGADHYIISKEDADDDGWRIMLTSANVVTCSVNEINVSSTSTITDTNWHLVGCTITRAGNGQVYIDGIANGTATAISSTAMATTSNILIGARSYTPTNYFNGQIDDARIYNYSLTATQVKTLYNENAAVRFGPSAGSP